MSLQGSLAKNQVVTEEPERSQEAARGPTAQVVQFPTPHSSERAPDSHSSASLPELSRWISEKWVSGERMLLAAILHRGALDAILYMNSWEPEKRRIGEAAKRWIFSDDRSSFTSFCNICDVLNLDPGWVRNRVMRLSVEGLPGDQRHQHPAREASQGLG